jgi:hypothetical protein
LKNALAEGRSCIIADIDFCRSASREEAVAFLAERFPNTPVSWIFFECHPAACRVNVRRDSGRNVQSRLDAIDRFAPLYRIPQGATIVPVWRP